MHFYDTAEEKRTRWVARGRGKEGEGEREA
jgi:hypothetical protein